MTSIIPLQNPQSRNNELTRAKVNPTCRPSGKVNMPVSGGVAVGAVSAELVTFMICWLLMELFTKGTRSEYGPGSCAQLGCATPCWKRKRFDPWDG